jgi:hypothetical protein
MFISAGASLTTSATVFTAAGIWDMAESKPPPGMSAAANLPVAAQMSRLASGFSTTEPSFKNGIHLALTVNSHW